MPEQNPNTTYPTYDPAVYPAGVAPGYAPMAPPQYVPNNQYMPENEQPAQ